MFKDPRVARFFVLIVLLSGCGTTHHGPEPAPEPTPAPAGETATRTSAGVSYCMAGATPLLADVAYPPPSTTGHPMLLFLHGGSWTAGSRQDFAEVIQVAAARGYVAATVDYRLDDPSIFPGEIGDAKCAVRWLRANAKTYGGDPARIGVMGASAGGELALMVGLADASAGLEGTGGHAGVPSTVRAVVNWFGPTDLAKLYDASTDARKREFERHLGGSPTAAPHLYELASPVRYLSADDPPVLTFHGTADDLVPYAQAVELEQAAEAAGVDHRLRTVAGGGHGFDAMTTLAAVTESFEFFDAKLK